MSILTGTLEGKSISNRGHSDYSLDMSGTLSVNGNPIQVSLFGQYKLPGGRPNGEFVITTGKHMHEHQHNSEVSWLEASFNGEPPYCSFTVWGQGGVFQGIKKGMFELKIELRKYGSMDDHWKITFGL